MARNDVKAAETILVAALCVLSIGLTGAVGVSQAQQQTPTELDSCTTITEPGRYVLTTDIRDSGAAVCIDIQSSDVHFDGNGYLIEGNLSRESIENASGGAAPRTRVGVGVNVRTSERVSNVTVENVTTTNWFHGVLSENVSGGVTQEVTARDNGGGIIYDNSSTVAVLNSTASSNVILGIIIDSRAGVPNADNRVINNTAEENGFFGVAIFLSNNSVIADNTLSENVFGIFAYGTSESTFADNDAGNNSAVGFALEGDVAPIVEEPVEAAEPRVPRLNVSQNNVVVGNDFSESGFIGMGFLGPSETYVADNNVSDIQGTAPFPVGFPSSGLYLDQSSNNVIVNNDANRINGSEGINGTGIVLANSSNDNRLLSNVATDNAGDGFYVNGSSDELIVRNTLINNSDDGIQISNSTDIRLVRNILRGNGDQNIEITDSADISSDMAASRNTSMRPADARG